MKTFLSSIALFALLQSLPAQHRPFVSEYEQKTIFQYGGRYLLNGQKLRTKDLEYHLSEFKPSGLELLQFKKNNSRSGLFTLVMLASYVGAFTQLSKNENLAIGLGVTGFAANIIAIPFSSKAKKNIQRSVWLYNRDVLAR